MRCVRCGWPSKNYEMSNDGRPYARLDAAYLLGALDANERLACEAHLSVCRRCGPAFAARRDGPGESGKVAGVVDARDGGKSAAVPLDLVNAGGAEIQPVKGVKRDAESLAQQDLYRGDVTYHQDGLAAVVPQQPVTGPVYPASGVGEALPAWRCLFGVAPPGCCGSGPSLLDFCQGEAIPVTEVGFPEIIIDDCGQAQFAGRNGGGGPSALQWRADHGIDRGTRGQATRGGLGLPGSVGAKRE